MPLFSNWCYQRLERIDLDEGPQREKVMLEWKQALKWWESDFNLKETHRGKIVHHVV